MFNLLQVPHTAAAGGAVENLAIAVANMVIAAAYSCSHCGKPLLQLYVTAYSCSPYGEPLLQLCANKTALQSQLVLKIDLGAGSGWRPAVGFLSRGCGGTPQTWTIFQHDGPNHLGL